MRSHLKESNFLAFVKIQTSLIQIDKILKIYDIETAVSKIFIL